MSVSALQLPNQTRYLPSLKRFLVVTASLLSLEMAASLLNRNSWNAGGVTILWPSNGFLAGVLLRSPRRHWPAYLAIGYLVDLGLNLYIGQGEATWTSLYLSACNMLEVVLAAALLYRILNPRPDLTERRQLFSLLLYGVVIAPAVAAFLASYVFEFKNAGLSFWPRLHSFQWWFTADALGFATVLPLYLSLAQPQPFLNRSLKEISALFLLLITASVYVFWQVEFPLLFVVLLCLLLLGVRTGLAGSALGLLVIAIIGGFFTTSGHGPVALMPSRSLSTRDLVFQVFVAIAMLALYLVEVVIAENKRLQHRALSHEARFRLLAEASRDIIALTDFDGLPHYISPAVTEMLGWTPDECNGGNRNLIVHPEDQESVKDRLIHARSGDTPATVEFRCRHKNGHYVWVEANQQVYREPETGEPAGLVIGIRDISNRKAAEEELTQAFRMVESLASIDGLTGIANRRRFDEALEQEWRRAAREENCLSVLLMDVDHFKFYNDINGHLQGDECLRRIAETATISVSRPGDLLARFGGEEFAAILANTDEHGAWEVASQIRHAVEACAMAHTGSPHGVTTVSIGCATQRPGRDSEMTAILQAADEALYRAKNSGRNRVEMANAVPSQG
jgi:diguanylate cyclase (GGDEF)-like protein/PAS domain S-box-containing protein